MLAKWSLRHLAQGQKGGGGEMARDEAAVLAGTGQVVSHLEGTPDERPHPLQMPSKQVVHKVPRWV